MSDTFFADAATRASRREPFATATVVRAEKPTSAKPGAKAIIGADGALHGWIGGSCAAPTVIRESLEAMADGQPRLILISNEPLPPRKGLRQIPMTCVSGGALEIYIEPMLPREQLIVLGETPVARAVATIGAALDMQVAHALEGITIDERTHIVVATRGESDEELVIEALRTPAPYVALVASRKRGDAVVEAARAAGISKLRAMGLHYPAGLDIGARTEEEIALTILAEIIRDRPAPADAPQVAEAIDPICGMTVAITPTALSAIHEGTTFYFCAESCRRRFLKEHAVTHAP
jgi:xanthine dehydrogenase accessory factor